MDELLLNLIAEGVGIIVTVLIIDRLIEFRQQRSWRPAIVMVHERVLTEVIDGFLTAVLPPDLMESVSDRSGWSRSGIAHEAESERLGKLTLRHLGPANELLRSTLSTRFIEKQRRSDKPPNPIAYLPEGRRLGALRELEGLYAVSEPVSFTRQRIIATFDHSGNLLGPELANMLRTTDGRLSDVERGAKVAKSEFGLLAGQYKIYEYRGGNPDALDKPELGRLAAERLEDLTRQVAVAVGDSVRQAVRIRRWLEADLRRDGRSPLTTFFLALGRREHRSDDGPRPVGSGRGIAPPRG